MAGWEDECVTRSESKGFGAGRERLCARADLVEWEAAKETRRAVEATPAIARCADNPEGAGGLPCSARALSSQQPTTNADKKHQGAHHPLPRLTWWC